MTCHLPWFNRQQLTAATTQVISIQSGVVHKSGSEGVTKLQATQQQGDSQEAVTQAHVI